MKAKLIIWFRTSEGLLGFLTDFIAAQPGLHVDVYSAISYRMATIPDVNALTSESGQLRFNAGGKGFTLDAGEVLRHEVKFYEVED